MSDNNRPCTKCKSTKELIFQGFTSVEGKEYPERRSPCHYCHGLGEFPPVDAILTVSAILVTRGPRKGKLLATMTSPLSKDGFQAARSYYVWRLARFHGGQDMRMPVMADMMISGDPFRKELDLLADQVAKTAFGTDMAAAKAWKRALYG